MFQLFALNATSTLQNLGAYSSAMFDELLPLVYVGAGFLIGGMLIWFVIDAVETASWNALIKKANETAQKNKKY